MPLFLIVPLNTQSSLLIMILSHKISSCDSYDSVLLS